MTPDKVLVLDNQGNSQEVAVSDLSFRISVYGVIVRDDKVLLSRQWDGYDFPGGGVELGETLDAALTREVREETGLEASRDKLLGVKDVFFTHPGSGKHYHWVLIHYSCKDVRGELSDAGFDQHEKEYAQMAEWVPISEIGSKKFYNAVDWAALIHRAAKGEGI